MKVVAACFVLTTLILCVLVHVAIADRPLQLTVRPLVALAPSDMRVQVRIKPDASDRWIDATVDGEHFYRSSAQTIAPDQPLYVFEYQRLPAGEYEIRASVGHGETIRASERATASIKGFEP